jgi:hypothetical protein
MSVMKTVLICLGVSAAVSAGVVYVSNRTEIGKKAIG